MKNLRRVILVLGLLIIGTVGYLVAFYIAPTSLNLRTIDISVHDSVKTELKKYDHQEHIHSIDFEVTGEISGTAELRIGATDTTVYQTYEIEEGHVNVNYSGDWYSDKIFVAYRPTGLKEGHLKIHYRFYGSTKY